MIATSKVLLLEGMGYATFVDERPRIRFIHTGKKEAHEGKRSTNAALNGRRPDA